MTDKNDDSIERAVGKFNNELNPNGREIVNRATQRRANARQVGGSHYKSRAIEPWDYAAANNLGYFEGSIIKYVTRWRQKNGIEDLEKAAHYLEKLIEVELAKVNQQETRP